MKAVELNWTMDNEFGIEKYIVERRLGNENDFFAIGTVKSNNNTIYSFDDNSSVFPAYYRVRIVGLDGSSQCSKSLLVNISINTNISIYPNPVTNQLKLVGLTGRSTFRITNVVGKTMMEQNTTANSLNIDLSCLEKGDYFITIIEDADRVTVKKFVKK